MNKPRKQNGKYIVLLETGGTNKKGYDCIAWYTRPKEELSGGNEFAISSTVRRLADYNRDKGLLGKAILVYTAPKQPNDKPIYCYDATGAKVW